MKKLLLAASCCLMAAAMMGTLAACGGGNKEKEPEEEQKHVHAYNENGVCECGAYDEDFITELPMDPALQVECDQNGTVERLTYDTRSYALESLPENEGKQFPIQKELLVYLPYGYDAEKQYNVVYLMHGTGDNQNYWLDKMGIVTLPVLDNMIKDGKCEPTIFVTPTYYSVPEGYEGYDYETESWLTKDPNADLWPMHFWQELRNDIIPAVEAKYSTYADGDVSEANLIATRGHRAFAGLSRGSMTTVNSGMMHCLDLFSYIGSFSGIWADFADFKAALEGEFADYEVKYWYNGTGTADTVGGAGENQQEFFANAIGQMPDRFTNGKNCCLIVIPGGAHNYNCWIIDLYNSMLKFFKV